VSLPESEEPEAEGSPSASAARRPPWWIPPFFGRVPAEVDDHQLRLLGLVSLALLFEHYDVSMLGSALKHIRESFGIPQSELGAFTALVRFGALPAFFLVPFADRLGRRRLFLACIVGMSLATLATAFAQTAVQFVAFQFVSRTFLVAGSTTALVIVSEELPAAHRGWGIGILGALSATGFGLGALAFAAIDVLPFGWRALYAIGVLPLLLFPFFRREVKETRRFTAYRSAQVDPTGLASGWWRPLGRLLRQYPGRTAVIGLIGALMTAAHAPVHQLLSDYVQTDHGWSPPQYSAMVILGGAVGILGNPIAGRLADQIGRRRVGLLILGSFPLFGFAFYNGSGWILPLVWIPIVFTTTGADTIVRALATELFPTAARGTATGWLMLLETLGASMGLLLVSVLVRYGPSYAAAIGWVAFLCFGAALLVLVLPETARRELETISE
jgi:MFS family permease